MSTPDESNMITDALMKLLSSVPSSDETLATNPKERAQEIIKNAAMKAAGASGAMALPPGPLGFATILPDLLTVWHIQKSMVADIAAAYGKKPALTRESMIYCLFKHAGAALVRDMVTRVGGRMVIRRTTLRMAQSVLKRIGIKVTQTTIGKSIGRWLPLIGAVGIGAYSYYDTTQVGATAIELFSQDLSVDNSETDLPKADKAATPSFFQ